MKTNRLNKCTRAIWIAMLLSSAACAHKQTEREVFADGVKTGYRMGHAPQILPITIQPVSLQTAIDGRSGVSPYARPGSTPRKCDALDEALAGITAETINTEEGECVP